MGPSKHPSQPATPRVTTGRSDPANDYGTLFDLLPIGAYRSLPDGTQLRANPALVRLNGYTSEAEMLRAVRDIGREWYVDPTRRDTFRRRLESEGQVVAFVSEIYRHRTRERIWISENAHTVRDPHGNLLFYEGTVEEITDRVSAARLLLRSEQQFRELTSQVPGMLFRVTVLGDGTRRFNYVSEGVRGLYGVSPEAVMADGRVLRSFRHPEDFPRVEEDWRRAIVEDRPLSSVFRIVTPDGEVKWVQITSSPQSRDPDGNRVRVGVILDISERMRAEVALRQSDELWKLALEATGDGVWDWNVETGVETFSRSYLDMYGYAADEVLYHHADTESRIHPEDLDQVRRDRLAHFDGHTATYVNEHRVRCRDGSWKWVLSRGMVIARDARGRPLRMVGTHTDISERKQSEALIWHQANFDALTGLPNRRMLRDRLEQSIKRARRSGNRLAVLFIDLDHFKQVNDTVGHDKGDQLLVEAAWRIRRCVRDSDTVSRFGGDEFTVLLSDLSETAVAAEVAQKIVQALGGGFDLGGETAFVSASVGITVYPEDATEIEDLFKQADQALYVAKDAGRNRVNRFTPELREAAQTRGAIAKDLRIALAEAQFRVAYQPIVTLASGQVLKAEALVRWPHPSRGLVSPGSFIPIAESTGLIVEIGDWVFREAAGQVRRWRERFDPAFQISVNKSPVQFVNARGSQRDWFELMRGLGLPGQALVLEITEGLLLDAGAGINEQLLELRDAGVGVSLDDFGTGYSSMSYLQRYDIDYLKIDQSFVRNLSPTSKDLALCKAIVVMAHELGLRVIAEGVETEAQRALLHDAGCDFGQGYLFARPMAPEDFEAWMAAR
jgi:diguanylate cyclase (GGDEF)-like protein/PAS domain S-box-containing protein